MADSFQCMTKPPKYCKVISLQLIKTNKKKKQKQKQNTGQIASFSHAFGEESTQIHLKTNKQKKPKMQSLAVVSFSTFKIKVRKCLQDSRL